MKKLQLSIVYSLSNGNAFSRIAFQLDVMVEEDWSAHQKHSTIINQIVKSHNSNFQVYKPFGYVKYDDIVINSMTRLD